MSRYDEFEPGIDFPFLEDEGPQKVVNRATEVLLRTRIGRIWPFGQRKYLGAVRDSVEDGTTIDHPPATKFFTRLRRRIFGA